MEEDLGKMKVFVPKGKQATRLEQRNRREMAMEDVLLEERKNPLQAKEIFPPTLAPACMC